MLIEKHSPIPVYYQIQNYIKKLITTEAWKDGEKIPSERELSEQFEVSRGTIRQAVQGLVDEGYLVRRKGNGTFVHQSRVDQPLITITSFTELMKAKGLQPSNELLQFKKRQATDKEIEKLKLTKDDNVLWISRLRKGDDIPVLLEETVLPWDIANQMTEEDAQTSIYQFIEKRVEETIGNAEQTITAVMLKAEVASYLQVQSPAAGLLSERVTFLKNGRPFEYVQAYYVGNRFSFSLQLTR
ncbi:GntR family transcriptional regulator [Metabacillus iocasae]|uniref:GntR family transcriptional regulator n=1 Tax=Priestia iocasae TaxID=2291674 RepID=A0ABS2QW44_9BACI|nr:GntR family transcriptional regulator [Metabacillus iocasae]MBM7703708.1 GntR family transcriptional regulator [Metabacillus iocasae]